MVEAILRDAGVNFRETRFQSPPNGTYAVYDDFVSVDGPDGVNMTYTHEISVEVYEPKSDKETERAIEDALDDYGLHYTKRRYWLQDEQRYQVIYEFTYIEKRRK